MKEAAASGKARSPGFMARMIYRSMKIIPVKKLFFYHLLKSPRRGANAVSAGKLSRRLQVEERTVRGFSMVTATGTDFSGIHVLFLHGGGYVAEAIAGHRKVMEILARKYGLRVTFLDYPLAPEHNAEFSHDVLHRAYDRITTAYPDDTFCLLGDSAGGGMALAFLQQMRDEGKSNRPAKTVLISPWLDLSMSNPEIAGLIDKDVLLDLEGLRRCAELFAGDCSLTDPLLSPLYGSMENLSEILLFVSTHEMFYADCLRLDVQAEKSAKTHLGLQLRKQMVHDWIVFPIPERNRTLREIADFFRGP